MAKKSGDNGHMRGSFLDDALNHYMDYEILLTQKTGLLVAILVFVLTITLTGFLNDKFVELFILYKLGVIIVSIGASFCLIIYLSSERSRYLLKTRKISPLVARVRLLSSKSKAYKDLNKMYQDETEMVKDYSSEIYHLKKVVYIKARKFTLDAFTWVGCMLIAVGLATIQLYLSISRVF